MPKDFLVQAAQAYIAQPAIQIGYKTKSGGVGTVSAIVMLHPIETAQAKSSTTKRTRLDDQSSRIHWNMPATQSIKEFYLQFAKWCLVLRCRRFRRLVWIYEQF